LIFSQDPLTIRLTFTPGGSGDSDCAYQLGHKENICVVCGRDDHNTKHHIVEYEYRKHFPEEYKSHNSYDIVILCGPCHAKYEIIAAQVKLDLANKYNAPVNGSGWYHDSEASKLKKAAGALLKARHLMPESRRLELESLIKTTLGKKQEEITDEELESIYEGTDPLIRTEEYVNPPPHPKVNV
jgi:exonuclease 3'-5' domain-containing protein 2